jgi:S1-C subfamily serine protease
MRLGLFLVLLGWLPGVIFAQEKVVQTFTGADAVTTPPFQVQDKWEVRWDSPDVISITVLSADNAIVSGASSSAKGSLYLPAGGNFHLQISRSGSGTTPWHASIVEIGSAPASTGTNSVANYIPPQTTSPIVSPAPPAPAVAPVPANSPLFPLVAPNADASPDIVAISLTPDQAHAIVVIKGDVGEGTGFLVKTADGPTVITNLHVISANPNLKILTTTGVQIKTLSLKGASDRDLAMIKIQDDHFTYLNLATNIQGTVSAGDEVLTPGNSEGGEVVLNTRGKVLGIGPEKIEFDNPIYHGNSGGPVFHLATGKVLGVVTQAMKVKISNDLDKASFANKNSAIGASMRYFALRIDTVPQWQPYDWNRFLVETTFLKNFHQQSRCLDSFMNGASYEKAHLATTDEDGYPTSQYYLRNEKLQDAHDEFHKMTTDADASQRLDAVRELVMNLEGVADTDMTALQSPANFYSFDQLRAKQEVLYRQALKKEIETFAGKLSDLGH